MQAKYDEISGFYTKFVRDNEHNTGSVVHLLAVELLKLLGDIQRQTVCDLACGEGHLSRAMAESGAFVVGIDISAKLLLQARKQLKEMPNITFQYGDAQALPEIDAGMFDQVVSNMAMMDFEDHVAVFETVARILKPDGLFHFSLLHPCFEPPFHVPTEICVLDEQGDFSHLRIKNYLQEGYWQSGGTGIRGKIGAHHRMLSTYVNDLLAAGFQIVGMHEPTIPPGKYNTVAEQWLSRIPRGLIIQARKGN